MVDAGDPGRALDEVARAIAGDEHDCSGAVNRWADVVFAQMVYDATDLPGLLQRWGSVVEDAPRELTSFLYAGSRQAQLMAVFDGADGAAAIAALTHLLGG